MGKRTLNSHNSRRGFTLIEMAVVLVIIGLILGAVSVGKDLQRNAEYKKIKQKFVDQWGQAYNQYYEKYGVVVGDNEVQPTLAVNGNLQLASLTGIGTGDYSAAVVPARLCQGNIQLDTDTLARVPAANNDLHTFFDQAGIRMPPGRAEGKEDKYLYLDSNGNPQELQICFQWNPPNTQSGAGNMMVIIGLTPDLARALDQMVDGKPDACEGMFRAQAASAGYGCTTTAGGSVGVGWTSTNVDSVSGAARNRDEDQILTLTAHYKMNQ